MGNKYSKEKKIDLLIVSGFSRASGKELYDHIVWSIADFYSKDDGSQMKGNQHLYVSAPNIFAQHPFDFEDNDDNLITQYGGCVLSAKIDTNYSGWWYWKFRIDPPQYDYQYNYNGYCAVQVNDAKYIYDGSQFADYDVNPEKIPSMWTSFTPSQLSTNIVYHEYCQHFTIFVQSTDQGNFLTLSGDMEYAKMDDITFTNFEGSNLRIILKPRKIELYLCEYKKKTF